MLKKYVVLLLKFLPPMQPVPDRRTAGPVRTVSTVNIAKRTEALVGFANKVQLIQRCNFTSCNNSKFNEILIPIH